jgi:heme/copper-type cytochrome/quinol oxidase subunit 2
VAFILTEDITKRMVLTDKWTILMVAIEILVAVFTFLVYYRRRDKDSDDGLYEEFVVQE